MAYPPRMTTRRYKAFNKSLEKSNLMSLPIPFAYKVEKQEALAKKNLTSKTSKKARKVVTTSIAETPTSPDYDKTGEKTKDMASAEGKQKLINSSTTDEKDDEDIFVQRTTIPSIPSIKPAQTTNIETND
ncbi:hypothetical protein L6452_26254 [Arctium lappa]|uniref:Uncharacterized protein n=1 Tax=Arctium lappa TaxID=4217 RepID=A0ACB9ABX2_ARCLA|nr:hypothetical protein L6452_26254 [Arctium lappa]